MADLHPLLLLLLLILFLPITTSTSPSSCPNTTATTNLTNYQTDFTMIQHQLRGTITITNPCTISISSFDLLPASPLARLWSASGPSLSELSAGAPISSLPLNRTFKNETLNFTVSPLDFPLIAVWDPATASDLGHAYLPVEANDGDGDENSSVLVTRHREPTMFDNCIQLSERYRLRWSLNASSNSVQLGLEAIVGTEYYMAFGWADPKSPQPAMVHGDVVVTGFTEDRVPFAEDYYISQYSECVFGKDGQVSGVCPDAAYEGSDPNGVVNSTRLVYGHRRDGVSFVRYERVLNSSDEKYDVAVDAGEEMVVMWALGKLRPPDAHRPYYLPQNHGGPRDSTFGFVKLNLSKVLDGCLGPLDAEDKEDQDIITVDGKTLLVVTSETAMHYPNPPNPARVIYINKKEAPLLKVERGVPVTFAVQAGHDVALYVTSDPIGGNATLRNATEIIYAGGSDAHGVLASPTELVWLPDRNTPDQVYYQNLYEPKMGWNVQVVDGGLSDMYNNSVLLDDQQVTLFWTLSDNSISFAARGEKKSGYLAIGFGSGMVNSYAYVGWIDSDGVGRVSTYWIDAKEATGIHQTSENVSYVRCRSENGLITFEFTRPLSPSCNGRVECKNIIDPTTPLKVIWAMGARWSDHISENNMHSVTSSRPMRVLLLRGSAEAEQDLRPVLAVHGFMMFVAWGVLLPGGILAARYLRRLRGDGWYQLHVYLQYSGIAIMLLGFLFAAAELRGFYVTSVHVKFGVAALVLACSQPINAYFRPKKPSTGEVASRERVLWEYLHFIIGRSGIVIGIVALFTGMKHLGNRYDSVNVEGLTWALVIWILCCTVLVLYLEYNEVKRRRSDVSSLSGQWVLGNTEEDDSVDLLHSNGVATNSESNSSAVMEVQLEPLNR